MGHCIAQQGTKEQTSTVFGSRSLVRTAHSNTLYIAHKLLTNYIPGSFVITNFRGKVNQNDPTPCQLDGSSQLMQLAIAGDQFYCETIAAVTPGEHTYTFSISTSPGSISFDWLSYFPVEIPHDSDIFYVADSALSRGGDSWVVNFTG